MESAVQVKKQMKRPIFFYSIVTSVLWGGSLFAQTRPTSTEPSSVTPIRITQRAGETYAGSETCRTCHRAEFQEFNKTHHSKLTFKGDAVTGCEMCHGGGKAHADAMEAAQGVHTPTTRDVVSVPSSQHASR